MLGVLEPCLSSEVCLRLWLSGSRGPVPVYVFPPPGRVYRMRSSSHSTEEEPIEASCWLEKQARRLCYLAAGELASPGEVLVGQTEQSPDVSLHRARGMPCYQVL